MFRNYGEFLSDYVDFYKINLFDSNGAFKSKFSNNLECWKLNEKFSNNELLASTLGSSQENATNNELLNDDSKASFASKIDGALNLNKYGKVLKENLINLNDYFDKIEQHSVSIGSTLVEEDGRQITIGSFNRLDFFDFVYVFIILITFILVKNYLTSFLQRSKVIYNLGLRLKDRKRLNECIWRLIFYSFSSTWLVYSCFVKHNSLFMFTGNKQNITFQGYSFKVDLDEYVICLIETSFYLHATYALVFEDVWRKDSPMMLVHHFAAIFSVASVYATRTHRIGLAIVVLRDTCDVLLEVTKLSMCLHIQHGKKIKSIEIWTKCSLWIFALSFVVNQLYYYPLFCLYHAMNVIKVYQLKSPTVIGMVTCSLIFLLLDLAWFLLILRLLYRMMFSKDPIKDLREYDCDDEENKNTNLLEKENNRHPLGVERNVLAEDNIDCKRKSD